MSLPAYESPNLEAHDTIGPSDDSIKLNSMFLRSIHGIMKITEIILCLICLICIGSAIYTVSTTGWLNFVAASALVINIFFLLLNLFSFMGRLPGPWVIIEFVFLALTCVFFILSMIIAAASNAGSNSARIATAIFCAITAIVFAAECIVRFRIYKEQGAFVISSTEVTTRRAPDNSVAGIVDRGLNLNNTNSSPDDGFVKPSGVDMA